MSQRDMNEIKALKLDLRGYMTLCEKLQDDIWRLRADLEQWSTWGIIEIAVRNPSVAEYMRHWEDRAEKSEARMEELERMGREGFLDALVGFWKERAEKAEQLLADDRQVLTAEQIEEVKRLAYALESRAFNCGYADAGDSWSQQERATKAIIESRTTLHAALDALRGRP